MTSRLSTVGDRGRLLFIGRSVQDNTVIRPSQGNALLADNGIEWAISVAPDPRIGILHEELRRVKGEEFEVVMAPQ